jgi:hypothetical protein
VAKEELKYPRLCRVQPNRRHWNHFGKKHGQDLRNKMIKRFGHKRFEMHSHQSARLKAKQKPQVRQAL